MNRKILAVIFAMAALAAEYACASTSKAKGEIMAERDDELPWVMVDDTINAKDADLVVENATSGTLLAIEAGGKTVSMNVAPGGKTSVKIPLGGYTIRARLQKDGENLVIEESVIIEAGGEYDWRLIDMAKDPSYTESSYGYLDDLYSFLENYYDGSYDYLANDYYEDSYGYLEDEYSDSYGYLEEEYSDSYGYLEEDYYDAYGYLDEENYDAYGYLDENYYEDSYGYLEEEYSDSYGYLEEDYYDAYGYLDEENYDAYGYLDEDYYEDSYGYLENSYAYLEEGDSENSAQGKSGKSSAEFLPQLAMLGGVAFPLGKKRRS